MPQGAIEICGPWPCPLLPCTPMDPLVSNGLARQLGELMASSGGMLVADRGLWGSRAHSVLDAPKLRSDLAPVGGGFLAQCLGNVGGWWHGSPRGQRRGQGVAAP